MSKQIKNLIATAIIVLSAANLKSEKIPDDLTPFVQLGHLVKVSIYKNATIDAQARKIVKVGELIKESIQEIPVGSGTIVSTDGLILTNYHVYQLEDKFRYDSRINRLYIRSRVSNSMLVYRLSDNDPLKAPVLQYLAVPVSLDKTHDTALLKIHAEAKGKEIEINQIDFAHFGNPFDLKLNQTIIILGYPAKGGDTITITEGKFLGYYRKRGYYGLDGFIKTDAAMSPGNSGGAALYDGNVVGVPTGITFPDQAGADMGYIHPITWATKVLIIAQQKFKFKVQDIPVHWLLNQYNTDETRNNLYLTGSVISSHTMRPLKAEVLVTRTDRSLEQIQNLHKDLQRIIRIQAILLMYKEGISIEEIARRLSLKEEEVKTILNTKLSDISTHPDVDQYTKGEFFYAVTRCDDKGFFIIDVPRNQKIKLYAFADGHRTMVRNFEIEEGISQDLGKIVVFKY
jgi:S1-C subfamily serine protease